MKVLAFSTILLLLALSVNGHEFRIFNHCPFTIWPGILNNPGKSLPEQGGFALGQYQTKTFHVPDGWAGRIWARTHCDGSGHCKTGDCGGKIHCNGAGGVPPVSLAEFTLDGYGNQDYYDVSLVDGYNLPVRIEPIQGTFRKISNSHYDCNPAGCHSDINAHCPNELSIKSDGWTIACKSACLAFNTDQYCCRGKYNTKATCKSSNWPVNYPAMFKQHCPDAYSYAYDDQTSTFTCHGNPKTGYVVIFCP